MSESAAAINMPTTSEGTPMTLTFNNLRVEIEGKKILDNISGSVKPGEVLAIMGPSGKYIISIFCKVSKLKKYINNILLSYGSLVNTSAINILLLYLNYIVFVFCCV